MKGYKTINTFSQRPSPAQLVSYLIFLLQILIFFIIIQARLASTSTRIVLIVVYSLSVGSQIVLTFLVSLSDPSDNFMIKYKNRHE